MERENLIPLVGLIGLVLAGALMLYATTGEAPPPPGARTEAAKTQTPAKPVPPLIRKAERPDQPPAPEGAPNVVLIVGCSVRRDAIGVYGGPETLTPRIDALAAAGVRFDDALAAGVWTPEALGAILTGRHALEVGLVDPGTQPGLGALPASVQTLPEQLAERGWWTVGVNASNEAGEPTGLWQGVDYLRDAHPEGFRPQHRLTDVQAAQQMLRMLNERPKDRPFYLQILLTDSHKPVKVPPPEFKPWGNAGLPNPPYMATVRRLDNAVGFLMDYLEQEGLEERTYVVFLADHGEGLSRPSHHGRAHGRFLAASPVRVPWIVRGPGIPAGGVVRGLASGVDVAPTVLALAGVDPLPEASGSDWSALLKAGGGTTDREYAIADTWYADANRASIWTRTRQCQKAFAPRPVKDGFVEGCYDRQADPDFLTPIADPELMARLVAWREARPIQEAADAPAP